MRKLLILLLVGLGASVLAAVTAGAQRLELPAGPDRDLVSRTCQTCHDLSMVLAATGLTRDGWDAAIDEMITYGYEGRAGRAGKDARLSVQSPRLVVSVRTKQVIEHCDPNPGPQLHRWRSSSFGGSSSSSSSPRRRPVNEFDEERALLVALRRRGHKDAPTQDHVDVRSTHPSSTFLVPGPR